MADYIVSGETLTRLADALRSVTNEDRTYTTEEMIDAVATVLDSALYILVDEKGNEYPAVFVEHDTRFTATANDIRLGKVAATAEGVTEGTKEIPAYYTEEGYCLVPKNSSFSISFVNELYNFTKLQAILCPWKGSFSTSVAADKVVLEEKVYPVNSNESLAAVIRDEQNKAIDLGIVNGDETMYIIRYFTYKEVY